MSSYTPRKISLRRKRLNNDAKKDDPPSKKMSPSFEDSKKEDAPRVVASASAALKAKVSKSEAASLPPTTPKSSRFRTKRSLLKTPRSKDNECVSPAKVSKEGANPRDFSPNSSFSPFASSQMPSTQDCEVVWDCNSPGYSKEDLKRMSERPGENICSPSPTVPVPNRLFNRLRPAAILPTRIGATNSLAVAAELDNLLTKVNVELLKQLDRSPSSEDETSHLDSNLLNTSSQPFDVSDLERNVSFDPDRNVSCSEECGEKENVCEAPVVTRVSRIKSEKSIPLSLEKMSLRKRSGEEDAIRDEAAREKSKLDQSFSSVDDDLFSESFLKSTQALEDALFNKETGKFDSPSSVLMKDDGKTSPFSRIRRKKPVLFPEEEFDASSALVRETSDPVSPSPVIGKAGKAWKSPPGGQRVSPEPKGSTWIPPSKHGAREVSTSDAVQPSRQSFQLLGSSRTNSNLEGKVVAPRGSQAADPRKERVSYQYKRPQNTSNRFSSIPSKGFPPQSQNPSKGFQPQSQNPSKGFPPQSQNQSKGFPPQSQNPSKGFPPQSQNPPKGFNPRPQDPPKGPHPPPPPPNLSKGFPPPRDSLPPRPDGDTPKRLLRSSSSSSSSYNPSSSSLLQKKTSSSSLLPKKNSSSSPPKKTTSSSSSSSLQRTSSSDPFQLLSQEFDDDDDEMFASLLPTLMEVEAEHTLSQCVRLSQNKAADQPTTSSSLASQVKGSSFKSEAKGSSITSQATRSGFRSEGKGSNFASPATRSNISSQASRSNFNPEPKGSDTSSRKNFASNPPLKPFNADPGRKLSGPNMVTRDAHSTDPFSDFDGRPFNPLLSATQRVSKASPFAKPKQPGTEPLLQNVKTYRATCVNPPTSSAPISYTLIGTAPRGGSTNSFKSSAHSSHSIKFEGSAKSANAGRGTESTDESGQALADKSLVDSSRQLPSTEQTVRAGSELGFDDDDDLFLQDDVLDYITQVECQYAADQTQKNSSSGSVANVRGNKYSQPAAKSLQGSSPAAKSLRGLAPAAKSLQGSSPAAKSLRTNFCPSVKVQPSARNLHLQSSSGSNGVKLGVGSQESRGEDRSGCEYPSLDTSIESPGREMKFLKKELLKVDKITQRINGNLNNRVTAGSAKELDDSSDFLNNAYEESWFDDSFDQHSFPVASLTGSTTTSNPSKVVRTSTHGKLLSLPNSMAPIRPGPTLRPKLTHPSDNSVSRPSHRNSSNNYKAFSRKRPT